MEDRGGGGGGRRTLQPHSLGISAPTHAPKMPSLVWDWEGGDQTTGDLKSHYLQARATLTAMSVPPRSPFLSAEL